MHYVLVMVECVNGGSGSDDVDVFGGRLRKD